MFTEMHATRGPAFAVRNRYSARKMTKPVNFFCFAREAASVCVVGDFNQWQPGAAPMIRQADGTWHLALPLHHGHHRYQFLVDGRPTLDPQATGVARDEKNEPVSLISVS